VVQCTYYIYSWESITRSAHRFDYQVRPQVLSPF
jgi:hypothetical protein